MGVRLLKSFPVVLVRVSIAVQRHQGHGNSSKGKPLIGFAYSSEVQSIIIPVGHGGMPVDMLLER